MENISTSQEETKVEDVTTEKSVEELNAEIEELKKRNSDQQRGVQTLLAEKKGLEDKLDLIESSTALDDIIAKKYPDFDGKDETMKNLIRSTEESNLNASRARKREAEIEGQRKLEEKINSVLTSRPELKEKETEFKMYVKKHPTADIEVLASAFQTDFGIYRSKEKQTTSTSAGQIIAKDPNVKEKPKTQVEKATEKYNNIPIRTIGNVRISDLKK